MEPNKPRPDRPDPLPGDYTKGGGTGAAGLGFTFAATLVLCVLLGNWIDGRYKTDPWGVLIGAAVGFGGGFYNLIRSTNKNGKGKAK